MVALVIKTFVSILIVVLCSVAYAEWKKIANFPLKKTYELKPKQQMSSTASEQSVSKELTPASVFQSAGNYHDTSETFVAFDWSTSGVSRWAAPTLNFQIEKPETPWRKIEYGRLLHHALIRMRIARPFHDEKQYRRTLLEELKILCKRGCWQQALLTLRNSNQTLITLGIFCLIALSLVYEFMLIEMIDVSYLPGNAISSFYRIVDSNINEQGQFTVIRGSRWLALLAVGSLTMKRRRARKQKFQKDLKRRIRTALTYQKNKPVQNTGWAEQQPWAREKRRISWNRSKGLNERWFEHLQKVPALAVNRIPTSPFRAQCVRYRRKKQLQEEQENTIAPRIKSIKSGGQEAPFPLIANRYLPTSRGTSVRQEVIHALLQNPEAAVQEEGSAEETAVKKERFARLYRDAEYAANANGADALIRLVGDDSEYLDTTAERKATVLPHQMTVEVSNKARVVVKRVQNGRTRQRVALRKTALRLLNNIGPSAKHSLQRRRRSCFTPLKVPNKQRADDANTDAREVEKARLAERETREVLYGTALLNPARKLDLQKLKTAIGRSTFKYRTKFRALKGRQVSVYERMKTRMRILMKNSSRRSPLRVSTRRHNTRIRLRREYARLLSLLLQITRKHAHATQHFEYKKYMRRAVRRAWLAGYYTELSRLEVEFASLLQTLKLKASKHSPTREKRRWSLVKMNIKNAALALWNRITVLRHEPLKIERTELFKNLGIKLLARPGQSLESYAVKNARVIKQPRANLYKFAYKSAKTLLKKKLAAAPHLSTRGEESTRKLLHFPGYRQQALRAVPVLSKRWPRRMSFLKTHAAQILKHSHTLLTKATAVAQAKLIAEQICRGFALHAYEEKSPLQAQLSSQEAFFKLPRYSKSVILANLRRYKLSAMLANASTLNIRARSSGLSELPNLQAHPLARMYQKRKGYLLSDWKQKYRIKGALSDSRLVRRPLKALRYVDPDRFVEHVLKYVKQRSTLYKNKNLNAGAESNVLKAERLRAQQTEVAKLKKMKHWTVSRIQGVKRRAEKLLLLVKASQSADTKRLSLNVRRRRAYRHPRSRQAALKLVTLRHELVQKRSSKSLSRQRTVFRADKKRSQAVARRHGRLKRNQSTFMAKRMLMKNKLQNFIKKQTGLAKQMPTFEIKKTLTPEVIFSAQRTKARRRSVSRYHTTISRERQSKFRRKLTNKRRKTRFRVVREKQKAILAVRRVLYLPVRRRKKGRYMKSRKLENRQRTSSSVLKRYLHARLKTLWKREALTTRSRLAHKKWTGRNTQLAPRIVNYTQMSLQRTLRGGARQSHRDKRPVRYPRLSTRIKQYVQSTNSKPKQHRHYNSVQRHRHARFHLKRKDGRLRKNSRPLGWHKRMRREVRTKYKRWLKGLHRYDHTKLVQWIKLPAFVEELHGSLGVESYYGLKLTRLKMLKRWKLARNRLFFRRRSRRFSEVQQQDFVTIEETERTETKNALKELKELDDYIGSQGELRMKKEAFGLVDDDILPANMEERINMSDRLTHGFTAAEEKLAQLRLQHTKWVAGFSRLQALRRNISPSTRLRLNARAIAENTVVLETAAATAVSLQNTAMQNSGKSPQLIGEEAENVIATVAVRQRFSTGRSGIGRLLEKVQSTRSEMAMQKQLLLQKVLRADRGLLRVNRTFPQIAAVVAAPAVTNFGVHQQERQLVHRKLRSGSEGFNILYPFVRKIGRGV